MISGKLSKELTHKGSTERITSRETLKEASTTESTNSIITPLLETGDSILWGMAAEEGVAEADSGEEEEDSSAGGEMAWAVEVMAETSSEMVIKLKVDLEIEENHSSKTAQRTSSIDSTNALRIETVYPGMRWRSSRASGEAISRTRDKRSIKISGDYRHKKLHDQVYYFEV